MIRKGLLFDDTGIMSFGPEGERSFGFRNFMELMSVFTSDPLLTVRHGREELGHLHPISLTVRKDEPPVVLLAGRSWVVTHTDWKQQVAYVEPIKEKGRSQWLGSGQLLHFDLCQAVRRVLARKELAAPLTTRGEELLEILVERYAWIEEDSTAVVRDSDGSLRWWTFAGLAANTTLGECLGSLQKAGARGHNLAIPLEPNATLQDVERSLSEISSNGAVNQMPIIDEVVEGLKFSTCLPKNFIQRLIGARMADPRGVDECLNEPVRYVTIAAS